VGCPSAPVFPSPRWAGADALDLVAMPLGREVAALRRQEMGWGQSRGRDVPELPAGPQGLFGVTLWRAPLCPHLQQPAAPRQPCPPGECHVRGLPGTPAGPCPGDGRLGWRWVWVPTLLLPSPGRVARAGRSGTAYSLVAPDEMPYVFDLHLFLGRPLVLAGAQEMPAGKANPAAGIGGGRVAGPRGHWALLCGQRWSSRSRAWRLRGER